MNGGLPMTRAKPGVAAALSVSLCLSACTPPALSPSIDSTPVIADSQPGWTVSEMTVGLHPLGLSCDALPAYGGPVTVPSGTRISDTLVTTPLDLSAGDITIERTCIQPTTTWQGLAILGTFNMNTLTPAPGKVTIRNSEIDGSKLDAKSAALSAAFSGLADLSSNYIHALGTGIALFHTGADFDVVVERNYVTDLVAWGNPAVEGNHSDAFTVRDFSAAARSTRHALIRNNRFNCDNDNSTGAIFIQAYAGAIDNVTLEGNLLEGRGWQLGLEAHNHGYSNLRAMNNRFSATGFGAAYRTAGPGWATWQDNYRYDPAAPEAKGEIINAP